MSKGNFLLVRLSLIFCFVMMVGCTNGETRFALRDNFLVGGVILAGQTKATLTHPIVKPGAYRLAGGVVYVGVEADLPDHPTIQFYDERTRRTGTLEHILGQDYRTADSPRMSFKLDSPISAVVEKPFVIENGPDHLGVSLWQTPGAGHHSTIVLIHGADDETREMGYLIPYFVSHGLNVVTYDQRGTGESTGNRQFTGPGSKADDVVAILQEIKSDPTVDLHRIDVWGFSNGGVDSVHSAAGFRKAFNQAGLMDLTIVTFPGADHTLEKSTTGYEDDPSFPEQTVEGYPDAIIRWLDTRGFTK